MQLITGSDPSVAVRFPTPRQACPLKPTRLSTNRPRGTREQRIDGDKAKISTSHPFADDALRELCELDLRTSSIRI